MKLHAVAYQADGESVRFYVHRLSEANGVEAAKAEARRLGKALVFVEDETGRQLFDGPAAEGTNA